MTSIRTIQTGLKKGVINCHIHLRVSRQLQGVVLKDLKEEITNMLSIYKNVG